MSDKRSVATDALETLGTIIDDTAKRDAIHLAVVPAIASANLEPGTHVELKDGIAYETMVYKGVGIVDPFLERPVKREERFWLILYPRTITSLRHVWSHPSFPDEIVVAPPNKIASEKWLRDFCGSGDHPDYDTIMELIGKGSLPSSDSEYYSTGGEYNEEYLYFSGSDAHGTIPPEFWTHAEIVLGRKLPYHPQYFSCSC